MQEPSELGPIQSDIHEQSRDNFSDDEALEDEMPSQIHQFYTNMTNMEAEAEDNENDEIIENEENEESADESENNDIIDILTEEDSELDEESNAAIEMEESEKDKEATATVHNVEDIECLFPMPLLNKDDIEVILEITLPNAVYKQIEKFTSMAIEKAEIINETIPEAQVLMDISIDSVDDALNEFSNANYDFNR